jgi:hypothetical protein
VKWLTNLLRIEEPGTRSVRAQLGIADEDERVFHPVTLKEAIATARMVRDDSALPPLVRRLVEVGLVLDLMPLHLTPCRREHARLLGVSVRTIRRRAIQWEGISQATRFDLTQRAMRAIIAARGARLR